jgi:activator of 2-hydroxyglutaryl-CoA dehydratase
VGTGKSVDVTFLVDRLRVAGHELCKLTKTSISQYENDLLPNALRRSNAVRARWLNIQALRRAHPFILEPTIAIDLALNMSDDWGTATQALGIDRLYLRMAARSEKASFRRKPVARIYWLHLRPYFPNHLFHWIRIHNVAVVGEIVNDLPWDAMNPESPYESLAKRMLRSAEESLSSYRLQIRIQRTIRRERLDGVVYFFHENCQWAEDSVPAIQDAVSKIVRNGERVSFLPLHGESLIPSATSSMETRLLAFLQALQQAKGCRPGVHAKGGQEHRRVKRSAVFIGVDAGSTFIKAVAIDRSGKPISRVARRISSSATASVAACMKQLIHKTGRNDDILLVVAATGVSQNLVEGARDRISEIICHTRGIRHILPTAVAAIDVGGQDSKGIDLASGTACLNDRCAAGIGNFLDEFYAMLNLNRRQGLKYYLQGKKGIEFPTLCKAIIETEVRHAVGRNVPTHEVVRSFHDALARIVVTAIKAKIPPSASPIVLCGGAVRDRAFATAMLRQLGHPQRSVVIPRNPEFTAALGAALLARDFAMGDGTHTPEIR